MSMTVTEAARWIKTFPARLTRNIIEAERTSAIEGLRVAVRWSQGGLSSATLARRGHPYRVQGSLFGRPMQAIGQDPALINKQSGLFASSWQVQGPAIVAGGDILRTEIVNMAPYSGFMRGTRNMIRRGIVQKVEQECARRRYARLARAIERAWSK